MKHEFRKLFWRVPEDYWKAIDRDISNWMDSPQLATPRDFWNGFHGVCMGFKLKIIYFLTAENVFWKKEKIAVRDLSFGVDLRQTRVIRPGRLLASEVIEFYADPKNRRIKEEQKKFTESLSRGTPPRDKHPIIVTEKVIDGRDTLSVYDGNRRLIKAILEDKRAILAFVGRFATKEKTLKNYWVPTTVLMEILYFAKEAFEEKDKKLFQHYMAVLRNILVKSEIAVYELKEHALTGRQLFKNEVLRALGLRN